MPEWLICNACQTFFISLNFYHGNEKVRQKGRISWSKFLFVAIGLSFYSINRNCAQRYYIEWPHRSEPRKVSFDFKRSLSVVCVRFEETKWARGKQLNFPLLCRRSLLSYLKVFVCHEVITLPNLPGWCWNRTRRRFSDSSWKKKSSVYVLRAKLIATAWISYREVQALVASFSEKISLPDWTKVDHILGLLQCVKDAKVRLKNAEMF